MLPELMWRFNGQLLNGDQPSRIQIRNHPSNRWSKLTIWGVSQEDNGYYECVVRDGYHSLNDGEASYFYVITSQRAQLKVIGRFITIPQGQVLVIRIISFPCTCVVGGPQKASGGPLL